MTPGPRARIESEAQLDGGAYDRSSVSFRPDHVRVSRQHPAEGASTYDGPGPFAMTRRTGAPINRAPSIFCILIHNAAMVFEGWRGTQRILLLFDFAGGELRGEPKSTPPMA